MTRRLGLLLCPILLLLTLLAACGDATSTPATSTTAAAAATTPGTQAQATTAAAANPGKQVELTFASWGAGEDATKVAFDQMIKGFEAKYPNIKVKSVSYPFNNMKDQLIVNAAGGNAPDVAQVHKLWVAPLVNAKLLQPLDTLLDPEVLSDFNQSLLNSNKFDNKLMAAPWTPSPVLIYYNKTLLKQAGIAEPPKTWDELIEQARKVAKLGNDANGNRIYGLGISSKKANNGGYYFLPFLWNNGGEFLNDKGQITLNTPENVKAFQQAQSLFDEKVTPSGVEIKDLRTLFAQGLVGFHFDPEVAIAIFKSQSPKKDKFMDDIGVMLVPGATAGAKGQSFFVEHNLAVFNTTKNPNEAKLLVQYLTSPEAITIFNKNGGFRLPARKSTEKIDFYSQPENAILKTFIESLQTARPLPASNEQFLSAMEELSVSIQKVGIDHQDPAKVVKDLDATIKALYKQ